MATEHAYGRRVAVTLVLETDPMALAAVDESVREPTVAQTRRSWSEPILWTNRSTRVGGDPHALQRTPKTT